MMHAPPSGTVTLLFTDIEGSTQLLQRVGDRYPDLLDEHRALLTSGFRERGGYEVRTEGDSYFVVFQHAGDAVLAALAGQRALAEATWPADGRIRVRMGLHTGEPTLADGDYVGLDVHRAARLCTAGHGGQILLSESTWTSAAGSLPSDVIVEDLGEHRLRDILEPEHVYQVSAPGLAVEFPPLRTLVPRPNNLPVQRGRIVDRVDELAAIRRLVLREDVGLVTLTGPGGSGKTRLALHVASHLLDHFEHGVFFVPLAPVSDPALVPSVIAQALGVRESPRRSLLDSLKELLRGKQMLLVLDNFEQVIEAATDVSELLASCPRLKMVVTSRERLQIHDERELVVPPLALPDPSALPSVSELAQSPAVAMFVERAMAARPDFALTPDNAADIVDICVHLYGLPLALELAAARVKLMPLNRLRERLGGARQPARLEMLVGGPRDAPARHRTLRDAIAWSYDLLTTVEQAQFRRQSVFIGGFDEEAAVALASVGSWVSGARGTAGARRPHNTQHRTPNTLDVVTSLVDKSLAIQTVQPDGRLRFEMLETIREFGLEQLAARGESDAALATHAGYFLALAERAEQELQGPGQVEWLARLDADHDNLRAALDWYLTEHPDVEDGPRLAAALGLFWYMRNQLSEGRRWIDRALAVAGARSPSIRAKLLVGDGALARMHNDLTRAAALLEEGAAFYHELGDESGVARALSHLGMVAQSQGQDERAVDLLERAVATYREVGDAWGLARTLVNLGCAFKAQGLHDRAVVPFQEGLTIKRPLQDAWGIPRTLSFLADSYLELGSYDLAAPLYEDALQLSRAGADAYGVALALEGQAAVATANGAHERAAALFRESLAIRRDLGDSVGTAEVVQGLAALEIAQGRAEHGARLLGAAETILRDAGAALSTAGRLAYERTLRALRDALDQPSLDGAWAAGASQPLDRVLGDVADAAGPAPDSLTPAPVS